MKSIVVKFRRVTRYGVAASLVALSCFSACADCTVTWSESDGGWWVDCHFGGSESIFVPDEGGGGGGGGSGGCTNCTAMTPAECEAAKDSIISECENLAGGVISIQNQITVVSTELMAPDALLSGLANQVLPPDNPAADYVWLYVTPVVQEALGYLQTAQMDLMNLAIPVNNLNSSIASISSLANSLDCAPCSSSGGGDSGGGGTSGGGGGTTPSGCPCSEFINAVKDAVNNCKTKLDDIDTKLYSIKARLDSWDEILKKIKDDVYQIRQTTDRMDDYFKDDTEVNFKKLIEHVLVLSNAVFSATVKLPPNLYWTEYTNATQFLDDSGSSITWLQKGKTIEAGADGAVIDFGEYGQLNWFQRMEFLLGHIAGIFSPTNSTAADFSSEEKEKTEDVQDVFDGLTFDDEKSILNQMVSYVEEAEGSLNPFHGIFDYSSGSTRSITFLPDVSVENDLLGNTMPMITMDLTQSGNGPFSISDLVDLAHNLTTFLWYVSFLIIDVLAIIKFVQYLISLNRWYWKIYNSWVSTMFSGGGR